MLPNPEIREVTIHDYLKILKKRIGIFFLVPFIIIVTTVIYISVRKPIYRATASILIEAVAPKVIEIKDVSREDFQSMFSQNIFQTQYKILTSIALAEKVADNLRASKDSAFKNIDNLTEKLLLQIKVEKLKDSQVVLFHVEDPDALNASTIANTFAKTYIQQDIEKRSRAAREASGWLQSQIGSYKDKVREAEEALNAYIQSNKIVSLPDIEKKTQGLLESLKENKSKLETELADGVKRYREKHPKIISLRAQLEDIEKKIEKETSNLLDLNEKMVQYNLLKKDVESNQEIYINMLNRTKETGLAEKIEVSRISIIDYAQPPLRPFRPNKKRAMQAAIILSLLGSVGVAFFLEYLDSTIRTAEDVSSYLNLPFLGYIPSITSRDAKTESEKALVCWQMTQSTIIESFRSVRTSILFAAPEDKRLNSIVITSSLPQEGKSFISSNLSAVFCQLNEKVILIDMDMRRPKLHRTLKIEQKPGLSDFLTGNIDLTKIIRPTSINNLFIIPAGTVPPNPSELLSSRKINTLFEDLKGKYDRIVIDSPPVLSVPDTLLLGKIADGIVLVIKGASTRLDAISGTKKKILEAKGKIIGVIVNNINPEREDKYYYYHYYYSEEGGKGKKQS
ncbi:MAG: polysaccharide biosynthesis tyrosine autokinase [Candidatus Omnitrophica bacterium]|nr:polysaccharide biosynthesis tyrosine autokinase [Candidatus Omnitrophota bacterium]